MGEGKAGTGGAVQAPDRIAQAGITFEHVTTVDGYHEVEALQQAVWQFDPLDAVPIHLLLTAHKNGGVLIAAREPGGRMIGFVFGFLGRQEGKLRHCSHMAGVLAEWRYVGLGERLKWLQLDAVHAQGLDLITWTFDPAQAPNAYLNFRKLGGIARTYTPNLYGPMNDSLNAGSDTDRLTVEWWIASERVRRRRLGVGVHGRAPLLPTVEQFLAQGADVLVRSRPDGSGYPEAIPPTSGAEVALVEAPDDFIALKQRDPDRARAWRETIRSVLMERFTAGWAAADFVRQADAAGRRGYYVLQPDTALALPPRLKV